jgi:hypothetical protein
MKVKAVAAGDWAAHAINAAPAQAVGFWLMAACNGLGLRQDHQGKPQALTGTLASMPARRSATNAEASACAAPRISGMAVHSHRLPRNSEPIA